MAKIIKNKRRTTNKKVNHKNQTRRFVILFIAFWVIFYLGVKISQTEPEKPKPKEIPVADTMTAEVFMPSVPADTTTRIEPVNAKEMAKMLCSKLGVLDNLLKIKEKDGMIRIFVPLNPAVTDLYFANYYFTKNLRKKGWSLRKGEENTSGNQQQLTFIAPDRQIYEIHLYYDNSNSYPPAKPKVSIIITELGDQMSPQVKNLLKLKYPLNIAVLPDRKNSKKLAEYATKAGYELLLNVPMEPIDYPMSNPGDKAVFVKMNENQIRNTLDDFYDDFPMAKGCINYMGSLATTDQNISRYFLTRLKEKNLYFIDNMTPTSSIAFTLAQKMVLSSFKRTDYVRLKDKTAMVKQVNDINDIRSNSQPIILVLPWKEQTNIQLLDNLCQLLKSKGFDIVFISKLEEEII